MHNLWEMKNMWFPCTSGRAADLTLIRKKTSKSSTFWKEKKKKKLGYYLEQRLCGLREDFTVKDLQHKQCLIDGVFCCYFSCSYFTFDVAIRHCNGVYFFCCFLT